MQNRPLHHFFPLASSAAGIASQMICGGVILLVPSVSVGEIFDWPHSLPTLTNLIWCS
jgi:hypothetical protein